MVRVYSKKGPNFGSLYLRYEYESTEIDEAPDKKALAKDLEALIKNPDPSRVKEYGGTKYVDMLKSKLAKLQEDEFEPHWMYDPETGEKERAEKPEDHERLKALGWGHEPPVNEAKIDNYVAALAKKYNGLKTIDPNSKDWKDLVKQLSNLSDADLKKVVDAKIKWASMMAEPMLKYGKHADKRHGGKK